MVHGSTTPYLGLLTIAGTEHRQGNGHQVITLVFAFHTRSGITKEGIIFITEYIFLIQQFLIDIDDDVTIHMTALVTATINVTTQQTDVFISRISWYLIESLLFFFDKVVGTISFFCTIGRELPCPSVRGIIFLTFGQSGATLNSCIDIAPFLCVPQKHGLVIIPTQWRNSQVLKVDFNTVLDLSTLHISILFLLCSSTDNTTLIGCIIRTSLHIGIITATHKLLVDINTLINGENLLTLDGHTTNVTTTIEGANETRKRFIISRVAI